MQLTDAHGLGGRVVLWARRTGRTLKPRAAGFVARAFDGVDSAGQNKKWARGAIARELEHAGFAESPAGVARVARAVRIGLLLQRAGMSAAKVAEDLGLHDDAHLRRILRETLGVTVTEIRSTTGWKWMLVRGLGKSGAERT